MQDNITMTSSENGIYIDINQQRKLQTPARPEPEEKRQVPYMEPINWQETTEKQKSNA